MSGAAKDVPVEGVRDRVDEGLREGISTVLLDLKNKKLSLSATCRASRLTRGDLPPGAKSWTRTAARAHAAHSFD